MSKDGVCLRLWKTLACGSRQSSGACLVAHQETNELSLLLRKPAIWYSGVRDNALRHSKSALRSATRNCSSCIQFEHKKVQRKTEHIKKTVKRHVLGLQFSDKKDQDSDKLREDGPEHSIINLISQEDTSDTPEDKQDSCLIEAFPKKAEDVVSSKAKQYNDDNAHINPLTNFQRRRDSVHRRMKSWYKKPAPHSKHIKLYSDTLQSEKTIIYSRLKNFFQKCNIRSPKKLIGEEKRKKPNTSIVSSQHTMTTPPGLWV